MLYREIIAVCSQIHTKHINTLCGQNVELLNFKLALHIATTGLYRVKEENTRKHYMYQCNEIEHGMTFKSSLSTPPPPYFLVRLRSEFHSAVESGISCTSVLRTSGLHDLSRRFGMRPQGQRVCFLHTPAIAQITLSSVKLCLALSKADCFRMLWNETVHHSLHAFYASKNVCTVLKINFHI